MMAERDYRRALSPDAAHLLAHLDASCNDWCAISTLRPSWRRMVPALAEIGAIERYGNWISATAAGRQLLDMYQRDLADADAADTDILDSPIWRLGTLFLIFVTGLAVGFMVRGGA